MNAAEDLIGHLGCGRRILRLQKCPYLTEVRAVALSDELREQAIQFLPGVRLARTAKEIVKYDDGAKLPQLLIRVTCTGKAKINATQPHDPTEVLFSRIALVVAPSWFEL